MSRQVGSIFEGMLPAFGVKINPDAFSVPTLAACKLRTADLGTFVLQSGFDIEPCQLEYSPLHDKFHYAFKVALPIGAARVPP